MRIIAAFFVFSLVCFAQTLPPEITISSHRIEGGIVDKVITAGVGIAVGDLDGTTDTRFAINWDVPPEDCSSKTYKWNGEGFVCLEIDRIELLISQRNFHHAAQQMNEQRVEALNAQIQAQLVAAVMEKKQAIARESCRKRGKLFDLEAAECSGALVAEVRQ